MDKLPQAETLTNICLIKHLLEYSYKLMLHTPGLFKLKEHVLWFTLCFDDSGVKHTGRENVKHLVNMVTELYK